MLSQKISKLYVEHFDVWYDPFIHNENSALNIDVQNETIVDTINSHVILNNGLAKISSIQSPYQSKTIEFNGQTNTGLIVYSPTDMNFDQNDFTIEMLIYPYSVGNNNYQCFFSSDIPNSSSIWIGMSPGGQLMLWELLDR